MSYVIKFKQSNLKNQAGPVAEPKNYNNDNYNYMNWIITVVK